MKSLKRAGYDKAENELRMTKGKEAVQDLLSKLNLITSDSDMKICELHEASVKKQTGIKTGWMTQWQIWNAKCIKPTKKNKKWRKRYLRRLKSKQSSESPDGKLYKWTEVGPQEVILGGSEQHAPPHRTSDGKS